MALPWFRVYSDLLNNRKFHQLSDASGRRLVLVWCLAAKNDGVLPCQVDIAFSLRLPIEEAQRTIDDLKAARFLDETDRGLMPTAGMNTSTSRTSAPAE
jgi:hypothetical protein